MEIEMTSQPSRRVRRRQFTDALKEQQAPRSGPQPASTPAARQGPRRNLSPHREHHVTTDYAYVRKDLIAILAVGIVTVAFIVGMSFAI
jgi:hypothetical protein